MHIIFAAIGIFFLLLIAFFFISIWMGYYAIHGGIRWIYSF
jgi:hypothetical protein